MIKCEVIKKFTLKEFGKLKDVKKVGNRNKDEFDVKDTFKCEKEMADYLMGENPFNETVIKILEVEPKEQDKPKIIEEVETSFGTIGYGEVEAKQTKKTKKKNKKASE